ncbi:MAG: hypothetical protein KJO07_12155 [Deltaproteobacteria bacterium]|nr:hypothetical protein [Deltaproteobacteria bacterium]
MRLACGLLVAFLLLGCGGEEESQVCTEYKGEAAKAVEAAEQRLPGIREKINAAATAMPSVSEEPCGIAELNPRQHREIDQKNLMTDRSETSAVGGIRSAAFGARDCNIRTPADQNKLLAELRTAVAQLPSRNELYFVEKSRLKPELKGDKKYLPGRLSGYVFVYNYGEDRVVCAGPAQASSGERLITLTSGSSDTGKALNNNLTFRAVNNGVKTLRKVPK